MRILIDISIILLFLAAGLVAFTELFARIAERIAPPQGKFVEIDGERIHYIDIGTGPVLFMIHGLAGNLRHFSHSLIGRLSSEFRIVAVDRPGSGYSTRARGAPANLRRQAETLAKVIHALDLGRVLVVGHSLGGGVSLALALDHPDRVAGLALLAPFTHIAWGPPGAFRGLQISSPLVRKLIAWTVATPLSLIMARKALAAVFAPQQPPDDFRSRGGGVLVARPKSFCAAAADMMESNVDLPVMIAAYPSLAAPTGVLYSRDDAVLNYRLHGETLKRECPALELVLIDGCGHMLNIVAADRAADFIRVMAGRSFA